MVFLIFCGQVLLNQGQQTTKRVMLNDINTLSLWIVLYRFRIFTKKPFFAELRTPQL
jgi:hypothetical protein